ncbi:FadR/GntR family transcriptional regulator [Texcoconibacillus texcoconensis]|uniref:GntR family transcriptional repressor for pyruvate dehydrogenase complex n=1 Tax=Texcoconibacillus texcoconensis TaxID=1095777 RepID=A0A840QMZ2_9BACI|nr:FadR/GntR family transcriptional regulator [Texcoconibacillus texcoconensis]MBB5172728.1 GntR family transcriptional repressor for pyruvate dehydrogenase complex [Texcoconibacillus texcoconensis]
MSEGRSKVYLEILKEIHSIIHEDDLLPGDKLPSERELAERLHVGRSSVREALRALELLDLIETRKGEGTFIQQAGGHRLTEILASFFLRDKKAREDVKETRKILEVEAIRLSSMRMTESQMTKLSDCVKEAKRKWEKGMVPYEEDYLFHRTIIEASHNRLMLNIWRPLVEYSKKALEASLLREGRIPESIVEHEAIFNALKAQKTEEAAEKLKYHLENSQF